MFRLETKNIILLIMMLSIVMVACSPEFRHKIANVLFDDVPSNEIEFEMPLDTVNSMDSLGILISASGIIMEKKIYYHEPYQKKECAKCHDQQHLGVLVAEEPELCYQCHEQIIEKRIYQHGPVQAGLCSSCHQPHKSNKDKLLFEDGADLCLSCHTVEDVSKNKIHQEIKDNRNCLDCHDPHAGDNRFMMKKGACYECHDTVNENEFSHGPVSGDFCSSCHDSHNSKNEHLLVLEAEKLCLNCHEAQNVFKDEIHKKEENKNCISCHDPHGGTKKFMLN